MPLNLRGVIAVAVPAVVMLFGFIWFRRRKKAPAIEQKKSCVTRSADTRKTVSMVSAGTEVSGVELSPAASQTTSVSHKSQDDRERDESRSKLDNTVSLDTADATVIHKTEITENMSALSSASPSEQSVVTRVEEAADIERFNASLNVNIDECEIVSAQNAAADEVQICQTDPASLDSAAQESVSSSIIMQEDVTISVPTKMHQSEPLSQPTMIPLSESLSQCNTVVQSEPETAVESKIMHVNSTTSLSKPATQSDVQQQSDVTLQQDTPAVEQNDSNNQSETAIHCEKQSETQCDKIQTSESNQKLDSSSVESVNSLLKKESDDSSNHGNNESQESQSLESVSVNSDVELVSHNIAESSHINGYFGNDNLLYSQSSGDWSKCAEQELNNITENNVPDCDGEQLTTGGATHRGPVESPTEKLMNSSQTSSNSEISNDSGKGTSVAENGSAALNGHVPAVVYEFNFPTDLCGRLIGRMGKNINQLKASTGAKISVGQNHYSVEQQTVVVQGTQEEVDNVLTQIRKRFPVKQFPAVDLTQIVTSPLPAVGDGNMSVLPDIMQLSLPEGVSMDVIVSSIVDAGHVFVQQPTHPTFPSMERLNQCMIMCYTQDSTVPQLPRPIDFGVICSAPMLNGWYRAQVIAYYEETDECDIKYVDYGGYTRIPASVLKQIRSDFTTLPFQAVECYLANVTCLPDEVGFSIEASAVLEEYVQGKLLQAQIVGHAEDGVPYVQIYSVSGNMAVLVNRELVDRGVARWIEQQ